MASERKTTTKALPKTPPIADAPSSEGQALKKSVEERAPGAATDAPRFKTKEIVRHVPPAATAIDPTHAVPGEVAIPPRVSGRYKGSASRGRELELRIDIDRRYPNSPIANRVSGDFWQLYYMGWPGYSALRWKTHRGSWIVDEPERTVSTGLRFIRITGEVRYWKGEHPVTQVQIDIPYDGGGLAPSGATVTISVPGGASTTYECQRVDDAFRDLDLEIDFCRSVSSTPLIPEYNTHWHEDRPSGVQERVLSIENAYREAGVKTTIRTAHTEIDDSAAEFASWTPDELHDAMMTHYGSSGGSWPSWRMWGLLAGLFEEPGVGGIMFDAAATFGGAGQAPERQGFAIFGAHSWFTSLVAGTPANEAQARAMRHFLYTWVHEAGHAFNLLHSWNKDRPGSLSWMNYDWRFDQLAGNAPGDFWKQFEFQFDLEELIHIRHGDRAAVIMGGDPWASGGHMEAPSLLDCEMIGNPPLEVLVRSQGHFEFMEPVAIELRLRNLVDGLPLLIDERLNPEYGRVAIFIRRPDGRVTQYSPVMCRLATLKTRQLAPATAAQSGADRYSASIPLTFGADGFYFNQPGEYVIRAAYHGVGDLMVLSNPHRLRIGTPQSREEDIVAQDFFDPSVGMALYLNGSASPHLQKGMDLLQEVARRDVGMLRGAKVAAVVGKALARPFFRVEDPVLRTMKKTHAADPDEAAVVTKPAIETFARDPRRAVNLEHHALGTHRANYLKKAGRTADAKQEIARLAKDLEARGVPPVVIKDVKAEA